MLRRVKAYVRAKVLGRMLLIVESQIARSVSIKSGIIEANKLLDEHRSSFLVEFQGDLEPNQLATISASQSKFNVALSDFDTSLATLTKMKEAFSQEIHIANSVGSITLPPGDTLLAVAEFCCSKRRFEEVMLPPIRDMRTEYFEALSQNRIWKARWIRLRDTYSFFAAVGLDRAFAFVSFFIKAWKSMN